MPHRHVAGHLHLVSTARLFWNYRSGLLRLRISRDQLHNTLYVMISPQMQASRQNYSPADKRTVVHIRELPCTDPPAVSPTAVSAPGTDRGRPYVLVNDVSFSDQFSRETESSRYLWSVLIAVILSCQIYCSCLVHFYFFSTEL